MTRKRKWISIGALIRKWEKDPVRKAELDRARAELKKQRLCRHAFVLCDLHTVNPDSFEERVAWPCAKCGKVFLGDCGLHISFDRGPIVAQTHPA